MITRSVQKDTGFSKLNVLLGFLLIQKVYRKKQDSVNSTFCLVSCSFKKIRDSQSAQKETTHKIQCTAKEPSKNSET